MCHHKINLCHHKSAKNNKTCHFYICNNEKNVSSRFNKIYKYMTSFETIDLDTYKKLIANERKIFDLSENFTTPEILNKYRHSNKNIDNKIKAEEMQK